MDALHRIGGLLAESGWCLAASFCATALLLAVLLIERSRHLTGSAWGLLPIGSRQRAKRDEGLRDSLRAYLAARGGAGTEASEGALLAVCRSTPLPAARFVLRALRWGPPRGDRLLELQIAEAEAACRSEVRSGLPVITALSRAAVLLGLLGVVLGLALALPAAPAAGGDPAAWREGVGATLASAELALLVTVPALLGSLELSRLARRQEDEISVLSFRLRGAPARRAEGSS